MMSTEPVVLVEGISRSYGSVVALQNLSFSVEAGQVLAFLGPNGAGKTTAMKILTGFLAADSGRALICGVNVEDDPCLAKQLVGYLPENNPLYQDQRVGDFLKFAADARRLRGTEKKQAIDRVVNATSCESVWGKFVGECSKGFRQRVGLAQALLHDPPLLILDEPTNGLDPLQIIEMRELVRDLGRTKTVILTSHVMPEVEALAERVILLHQGQIVADGPLNDLRNAGDTTSVKVSLKNVEGEDVEAKLRQAIIDAGLELSAFEQTGDSLEDVFRRFATSGNGGER